MATLNRNLSHACAIQVHYKTQTGCNYVYIKEILPQLSFSIPNQVQKFSYTLNVILQTLKQPGSSLKQVQKLSYTLIIIFLPLKQPGSTPTQVQKLSYTLIITNSSAEVELHIDFHFPTAWQHIKTGGEVELKLHLNYHFPTSLASTPKQVQKLSYTLIIIFQPATPNEVQKLSYTLIIIFQPLHQPGSTPKF